MINAKKSITGDDIFVTAALRKCAVNSHCVTVESLLTASVSSREANGYAFESLLYGPE
jgi:hypothetical protein